MREVISVEELIDELSQRATEREGSIYVCEQYAKDNTEPGRAYWLGRLEEERLSLERDKENLRKATPETPELEYIND